jgi:hypothetical protein
MVKGRGFDPWLNQFACSWMLLFIGLGWSWPETPQSFSNLNQPKSQSCWDWQPQHFNHFKHFYLCFLTCLVSLVWVLWVLVWSLSLKSDTNWKHYIHTLHIVHFTVHNPSLVSPLLVLNTLSYTSPIGILGLPIPWVRHSPVLIYTSIHFWHAYKHVFIS